MTPAGPVETTIATLRRLGVERSTGALEISGPAGSAGPRGWIHFVDGAVAYAEATAVPGIDVRLLRADLVPAAAVPDADLERIVRSATADATVSLLGTANGARCRFQPGLGRWSGRTGRTGRTVDDLLDEAAAGLRMLAASRVGPDDTVALGPAGDDGVVLAPPQMAVLVGLTDGRTPRQAAWTSGLAVLDTVAILSDLVDQGVCAVVARQPRPDAGEADLTAGPSPRTPPAEDAPPAPLERPPLPCRRRVPTVRPRSGHEPVVAVTDAGILTRLIEGLRRE